MLSFIVVCLSKNKVKGKRLPVNFYCVCGVLPVIVGNHHYLSFFSCLVYFIFDLKESRQLMHRKSAAFFS